MYYSTDLLSIRRKGKLSQCWLAATVSEQIFKKMCRAGVISGIDISVTWYERICIGVIRYTTNIYIVMYREILFISEEIVKVLQTTSNRPYKRFSLYLSSQLMYGTVKIFWYQTIIFQNYLFEIKQKLERHVEAQRYIEGSEIREPPDILNVVQNYHDAHLDDNLHILEDESQADRLQAIMQDAACLNFGALNNEELELMLMRDETISLEMLYRAHVSGDYRKDVMSEITDEMEEQSYEAMRGTAKEAISIEESGKGLTTPKRHGSGDISVDTPSKKRRLTFEDNTGIVRELIPSILHSAMDEEQPPTILESQLELESLHSSIILAQRRQKMSRMIDKNTMLNRDIIIACCRNVTVFTRKLEPPVLMIPTVIKLLTQPSMCTSSIREKVWCDSLRKLFNDHITGPFTRETDHGKSHEAIRVLDTISKSEDPLTEISSAIGTMAIDQMEHSKTFEKVLPETAEKVPPLIEGMDTLEKVDDTSVGVHLPEITAMDVDTIQEEDIGESAANLVQRKELVKSRKQVVVSTPKRSVTYIESAHSMSSSPPSTCLTKHDLCALLEVLWLDKDYIQFTELLSPNDYTRLDAAVSFLYLLEFHTERKMILKQASPYSSIWIQRHMSYMHARDM